MYVGTSYGSPSVECLLCLPNKTSREQIDAQLPRLHGAAARHLRPESAPLTTSGDCFECKGLELTEVGDGGWM